MWYSGTLNGYYWLAKVYVGGSQFGINGGPVSKLSIYENKKGGNEVYNYERGLDFDRCPPDVLAAILAHCETLNGN
jgi:hypothetical protein